jgi:hypothetical protein
VSWVAVASAAVGVAGSVYSSHQASKAAKGSKAQQNIEGILGNNLQQSSPYGLDFLRNSQQAFQAPQSFFGRLAGGSRTDMMNVLGPQLSQMGNQYRDAFGSSMSLMPRSGGGAERRLGMLDSLASSQGNSILNARLAGNTELANLGATMGNLGNGVLSGSNSLGTGLLGNYMQKNMFAAQQGQAAGSATFGLMQWLGNMAGSYGGGSKGSNGMGGQSYPHASDPASNPWGAGGNTGVW